jgi:DNA-binding NarL/FixJ family response regulator
MNMSLQSVVSQLPKAGLLVVDDHDLVRLGLRTMVAAQASASGFAVQVYEARTVQAALVLYQSHQLEIHLVLLDLHLPDAHGMSGLNAFVSRFPDARVVILSADSDPALRQEALNCGALAFHSKAAELPDLMTLIRGKPNLALAVNAAGAEAGQTRLVRTAAGADIELTARQAEVIDCLLAGQSNREIAEATGLSEGTIKNLVSTLLLLFGVRSRAQLISQLR